MPLIHETGLTAGPLPVYFETFSPMAATGKPTVVMVHGGAHSGACYQRTADGRRGWAYLFAEHGYRVVVPDWPGTGRSGHVALDRLTGATVVEGLGALIRALGDPNKLAGKRILVITGTDDLDHSREVDGAVVTWLNALGAKADFCFLADRGIVGNGHMLMLEQNSDEIAAIILDWLEGARTGA